LESELERSNHNFSASNQCAAELSQKLAEKEKEIETPKTQLRDNALFLQEECSRNSKKINELYRKIDDENHWYHQNDKRVKSLEDAIEKAAIDIWNTKSIFGKWHSKTLEKIRKDLMNYLPTETQIKLLHLHGFGPPNPIPEPPERPKFPENSCEEKRPLINPRVINPREPKSYDIY